MSLIRKGGKLARLVLTHPKQAIRLVGRRIFPIGTLLRDPEAYHVVSSWTYGSLPRVPVASFFPDIATVDLRLVRSLERDPDTSLTLLELATLCGIVRLIGARRVLEIGTFDGGTALNLAANIPPDGSITTVDLPVDWSGDLALDVPDSAMNVTGRQTVGAKYRGTSLESNIRQVYGDSAVLDWSTLGGPYDLVFIDGCHSYDYVTQDTANGLQCLRPGGVMVWHDYGIIADVSAAVDKSAQGLKAAAIRSTSLAVAFAPELARGAGQPKVGQGTEAATHPPR